MAIRISPAPLGPDGALRRRGYGLPRLRLAMTEVDGGWSSCFAWAIIGTWSAGAMPPALRVKDDAEKIEKCRERALTVPRYDLPKLPHLRRNGTSHRPPLSLRGAKPRGNLLHHVSTTMASINIVHPGFSMLISLSPHPTAAVEIATAFGLAMTEVDGGWSFYFRWRSPHMVGGVVLRAANL